MLSYKNDKKAGVEKGPLWLNKLFDGKMGSLGWQNTCRSKFMWRLDWLRQGSHMLPHGPNVIKYLPLWLQPSLLQQANNHDIGAMG